MSIDNSLIGSWFSDQSASPGPTSHNRVSEFPATVGLVTIGKTTESCVVLTQARFKDEFSKLQLVVPITTKK